MKVRRAREVAAEWAAEQVARDGALVGAFLSGSVLWLDDDADLPATSDVDVTVVTEGEQALPVAGKFPRDGVLLEATPLPWAELVPAERVLSTYYLAGSFHRPRILADRDGRLAALRDAVAPRYPRRPWVLRRCASAERRITDGLDAHDPASPWPRQVISWLFPTGVTTHVLLTAGLRNPTVRLRYCAVRDLLTGLGRPDVHEELLELLGCRELTPDRAEHHLRAVEEVFEATVPVAGRGTPFPFGSDITAAARPVAIDGSRELIERGLHREAAFWITATYARCLTILHRDAPDRHDALAPGFAGLLADLGIDSRADLLRRAGETRAFLPRLRRLAREVAAATPEVRD